MNTNQRANQMAIQKYRKELMAMISDIKEIDERVLTKAVNVGESEVKQNTPVDTGFMKKQWYVSPTKRTANGVEKRLYNIADYASYVNYGHRIVKAQVTVGFVKGRFMLEKSVAKVNKTLETEFKKEVERVNRKHDK
ncbi:hypothetical protein CS063_01525 [Sporanaerobium hydrogeniformans]|uniref:Uncharacterized protein n=1 Tax=Sporanaerobium hydrogeniformans TaxID=3072179 RepID=A0AC61DKG6_9FIRM|nr:HK97 gp10 family phage protein [Sporanaerobium hydrogeniformans]PHV72182.1 hypothetical protein CS063_01525 [Sporanaerobium hydrogeniformans]